MVVVYSKSRALKQYLNSAVDLPLSHKVKLALPMHKKEDVILLLHHKSYAKEEVTSFIAQQPDIVDKLAILDDLPSVQNMLMYAEQGIKGYCNSYMASPHYAQLFRLLSAGHSWYPPELLNSVFTLAQQQIKPKHDDPQFQKLTEREKQIAYSVAENNSNKMIAHELNITERTVKAHLGRIYEKLQLKDRVALAIYIKQQGLMKTGT